MTLFVTLLENSKEVVVEFSKLDYVLETEFEEILEEFSGQFQETQEVTKYVGGEPFYGDYNVVPSVEKQTLNTKNKVLTDDIVVASIPYYNVSNTSGGRTAYIGREL